VAAADPGLARAVLLRTHSHPREGAVSGPPTHLRSLRLRPQIPNVTARIITHPIFDLQRILCTQLCAIGSLGTSPATLLEIAIRKKMT
jgi:hypothetical protein